VLIAHQLVGPKIQRLIALIKQFPNTNFSTIIDNLDSLYLLHQNAHNNNIKISFYIDINSGMNRSGVELGKKLTSILKALPELNSLQFLGLHVYDGHLRDSDFNDRKAKVESEISSITKLFNTLKESNPDLKMICGGTPAFTAHLMKKNRICSPGTCVFWDWGYGDKLLEQDFKPAVLLITRIISKPTKGIVTIDLGHKAVASENPINQRVKFLNLDDYSLLSQSEEHGVLQVKNWDNIKVGDVFYGLPYHICPTINLYDEVSVIKNELKTETWEITARKRKITI
jgi:D-serine deaminase-like pyridoxal phosphate-dependent protein